MDCGEAILVRLNQSGRGYSAVNILIEYSDTPYHNSLTTHLYIILTLINDHEPT